MNSFCMTIYQSRYPVIKYPVIKYPVIKYPVIKYPVIKYPMKSYFYWIHYCVCDFFSALSHSAYL